MTLPSRTGPTAPADTLTSAPTRAQAQVQEPPITPTRPAVAPTRHTAAPVHRTAATARPAAPAASRTAPRTTSPTPAHREVITRWAVFGGVLFTVVPLACGLRAGGGAGAALGLAAVCAGCHVMLRQAERAPAHLARCEARTPEYAPAPEARSGARWEQRATGARALRE
ncbi:hypothetical protein [Streptomyces sp. NPDC001054]